MQLAVDFRRGARLLDPNLITPGGRALLFGLYDQLVIASRFRRQQYLLLPPEPLLEIELYKLGAIRPQYLHSHVNALLLDDRFYELTGGEPEPVAMLAPAAQFALDRMPLLKQAGLPLIDGDIRTLRTCPGESRREAKAQRQEQFMSRLARHHHFFCTCFSNH